LIAVRPARILLLGVFALPLARPAHAQDGPEHQPEKDLEAWFSAALETKPFTDGSGEARSKFAENFRVSMEAGYRSNENLGFGKQTYVELGLRHRITEWLRVGTAGRYTHRDKYSNDTYRLEFNAVASMKPGRFDLSYRPTWQHEFIPAYRVRTFLRNKVEVQYNIKGLPLNPFVSAESFTALYYKDNFLAGMRYDAGVQWSISKDHTLDLMLRHDREIGVEAPKYRTIINMAYEYYWRR